MSTAVCQDQHGNQERDAGHNDALRRARGENALQEYASANETVVAQKRDDWDEKASTGIRPDEHDAQIDECVYGHERELPPELDAPAECGDQPAYSRDHTNDNAESGPIDIQESRQHIVLHVARYARKKISESNGARGKVLLVFQEELI